MPGLGRPRVDYKYNKSCTNVLHFILPTELLYTACTGTYRINFPKNKPSLDVTEVCFAES